MLFRCLMFQEQWRVLGMLQAAARSMPAHASGQLPIFRVLQLLFGYIVLILVLGISMLVYLL